MTIPTALDYARLFSGKFDWDILPQDKVATKLRELADAIDIPKGQYPRLALSEAHSAQDTQFGEISSFCLVLKFQRYVK